MGERTDVDGVAARHADDGCFAAAVSRCLITGDQSAHLAKTTG